MRTGAEQRARRRAELSGGPSLAVLPFAGAGEPPAPAHLCDGLAEDIATEIARFRELQVIAPASALACRPVGGAPERVGRELGASYVAHGSLRMAGEQLRMTARLIEAVSGRQLWAERFDCAPGQWFTAQDQVIRRIVGTLVGRIEDAQLEAMRGGRGPTSHSRSSGGILSRLPSKGRNDTGMAQRIQDPQGTSVR